MSTSNFNCYDSAGHTCKINPDIEYTPGNRNGEEYFVAALKNKSSYVDINFKYNSIQVSATAKIKLAVTESQVAVSQNTPATSRAASSNTPSSAKPADSSALYAVIGILFFVIVALLVVIIVLIMRRR